MVIGLHTVNISADKTSIGATGGTATNQINEINLIKEKKLFDLLSEKDKIAADYRIKYPESSLQELAEIISIETNSTLTKSGLHHRFNRIKSLANKIKNNE